MSLSKYGAYATPLIHFCATQNINIKPLKYLEIVFKAPIFQSNDTNVIKR